MYDFGNIRDIKVQEPESWTKKMFITIDIDWCCDEILKYCIDLIEENDICATWFITHETSLLQRLRENPHFEIGIHPNYNPLLKGNFQYGSNSRTVIKHFMDIVPEAVSVRSHSLTQSSSFYNDYQDLGLKFDCNEFMPFYSGICLKPYTLWNTNIIRVPYFWEDDVVCQLAYTKIEETFSTTGLKIYDFHPIHIFLNSENLHRYEQTRHLHHKPDELSLYKNDGVGIRTQLLRLLSLAHR
ncbi:MAG: hypothetical protein WC699_06885 [Bacteroidales bacterium]|jgi:hypothetical protein